MKKLGIHRRSVVAERLQQPAQQLVIAVMFRISSHNSSRLKNTFPGIISARIPNGIYTLFSLSLGRVASELASLRGGAPRSSLAKSGDVCRISPLLAEARLSPGRLNFLCQSCVDTNAVGQALPDEVRHKYQSQPRSPLTLTLSPATVFSLNLDAESGGEGTFIARRFVVLYLNRSTSFIVAAS
jgi:hypothetical protein